MKKIIKKFIPRFLLSFYHFLLAWLGAIIYSFPSKELTIIGTTGTNGKTTVVHLISEILEKTGNKVASISSIRFKINDKEWPNTLKMTMPGRFKIQKFFRDAVKAKCNYMVLEVTSEGIKQYRHRFIEFDGAVFTNLTREHLEAHKGFENYKRAKGRLFKALKKSKKKNKFSVINLDDLNAEYFLSFNIKKEYRYGIKNEEAEITPDKINLKISLPGEFNTYNALAAYCVGLSQNIETHKILDIIKEFKGIPGRMELVIKKPFKVFVDYAHTPDALEKVYKTILSSERGSSLICVLGSCGGGRDKWKRPEMGKLANKYCSRIILTNEDPYDENPEKILSDVESGITYSSVNKILDRRQAINKALRLAKEDDIVVITGKGNEPWMVVAGGRKISWDDRKVAKEEFSKLFKD